MFAVVQIPDFPLQALMRFQPALRGDPVAVLSGEGRRAVIAHANEIARGVRPGMTVARAMEESPGLQLLSRSPLGEREAGSLLLAACWSLSPRVEATAAGLCTVDLTRADSTLLPGQVLRMRSNLTAQGLTVWVGLAENPLVARLAAEVGRGEKWIEERSRFLEPLPLTLLALTADESDLFGDLGLRTLGSITAFPRAALANRLGARGEHLWAQAAGEWTGTMQPAPYPVRFFAEMELEEPVETLEPLLFMLRRFTERLAAEVCQIGEGTRRVTLCLQLADEKKYTRDFDLPEPTGSPDALFAVLEHHLSALHTDAAIVGLSLEAFPAKRVEQQAGLFDTSLTDAPAFFATLGYLAAIVGSDNVGTPRRQDTHRPDSVVLGPPSTVIEPRKAPAAPPAHGPLLRRIRPPMPATVELTDARPTFLASSLVTGQVTVLRRPFWSNGGWFEPIAWSREEWDVRIASGMYRILHDPHGWFIDGLYD